MTTRIALSMVLGFCSPCVFILGAEPFEVKGSTSLKELLAGCLALALYFSICEFLLARTEPHTFRNVWPTMAGMAAPLLMWVVIIGMLEQQYATGEAMLLSGIMAIVAGGLMAMRGTIGAHSSPAKR